MPVSPWKGSSHGFVVANTWLVMKKGWNSLLRHPRSFSGCGDLVTIGRVEANRSLSEEVFGSSGFMAAHWLSKEECGKLSAGMLKDVDRVPGLEPALLSSAGAGVG